MTHVTVTLDPAAFGLPSHPDVPGPTFDFDFAEVTIDDPRTEDPLLLELVWAICNSYPQEMFCPPGYADVVADYRGRQLRSLSVGDFVALTSGGTTRRYRVASFGFQPAE